MVETMARALTYSRVYILYCFFKQYRKTPMERWFLTKQYLQWVVINKQIEQLNKRDVFAKNSASYLPVVSKLQELYTRLQKNLEEVLVVFEDSYNERQEKWEYGIKVANMQWDLEAARSLLVWAEQSMEKEQQNIEEMKIQKQSHEQRIWDIRDTIREITAKSWYSTTELNTLLKEIEQHEKKIGTIDTSIWKAEKLISSNEQGKISLDQEILGIEQQLETLQTERKGFDKKYYSKKILDVFTRWYDSRPKKTTTTYSTTEELFGIKPIENNGNLLKDGERPRTWLWTTWTPTVNMQQKLEYNKIMGVKNVLDALGVTLDENTIHQFNDVLYIYAKDINKGIIVSNKKFVIWEKEVFTHATFVIPGSPILKTGWWITFPTPLYARRIRFDNAEKREKDLLDSLLKDNNDELFKKVIHTYNEENSSGIKLVQEKVLPIAEQATEACVVKEIIRGHFTEKSTLTIQAYVDFASTWNANPNNKYKLKSTLVWLRNVLGAKKPIDKMWYVIALLYDDQGTVDEMEEEYDNNIKTVYNNEILAWNINYLIQNKILTEDGLWSIQYVKVFVENCAKHICEIKNIDFSTLEQKEKYRLISETYEWLTWVPSSLTIALWWLQSRDRTYQILLLQKFIAKYEGKDASIIKAIQDKIDEREPRIAEWLGWVEKNIFKAYKVQPETVINEWENDVEVQLVEKVHHNNKQATSSNVSTVIQEVVVQKTVQKEKIVILPEELDQIPENVKHTINRVVKIVHTASIDGHIDHITRLLYYWYLYCRKNTYLKKDTEKPHSFFGKFYQEKYIIEICDVAEDIPDIFKLAFSFSCTERKMWTHIKKILEIQWITNKRK